MQENLRGVFGELRDCQFVVPASEEDGNVLTSDMLTVTKLVDKVQDIFPERVNEKNMSDMTKKIEEFKLDPTRNHVFIGLKNPFVSWIMGIGKEPQTKEELTRDLLPEFPYTFRWIGKDWCIVKEEKEKVEIHRPGYSPSIDDYNRDYIMLLQIPSIFKEARGNCDYAIASPQYHGIEGIDLVFENKGILDPISEASSDTGFFQAIVEVNIDLRPKSKFEKVLDRVYKYIPIKYIEKYKKGFDVIEPQSVKHIKAVPIWYCLPEM
jgi:hypothetical protein